LLATPSTVTVQLLTSPPELFAVPMAAVVKVSTPPELPLVSVHDVTVTVTGIVEPPNMTLRSQVWFGVALALVPSTDSCSVQLP